MKIAIALATVLAVGLAMPSTDANSVEWENYKQAHGKSYDSGDMDNFRKNIYFQNKDRVVAHNERYSQGLVSYSLKLNHFADQLPEEVAALRGFRSNGARNSSRIHQATDDVVIADTIDWRTRGAVTPVKNQGQCGSCWAFSTTGSLEAQMYIKRGKLTSLSEQQLVDCSSADGCGGGLMDDAFDYIKKNNGIDSEASYPYTAEDGTCAFTKKWVAAHVAGRVDIKQFNETDLLHAVATVGPVSVAIDASGDDFQLYSEGVYSSSTCSSTKLDHGVLAVGYGVENGTPYWLVKNSWGPGWGEAGYIKMSRNKDNQCGIATIASYPLVYWYGR